MAHDFEGEAASVVERLKEPLISSADIIGVDRDSIEALKEAEAWSVLTSRPAPWSTGGAELGTTKDYALTHQSLDVG